MSEIPPPDPPADRAVTRVEELVGRVGGYARRVARPVGIAGWVGVGAGIAVWWVLPGPVWPDRPPWWSSLVSLVVLCAPGAWLLLHRRWLDHAVERATEVAPAATAMALQTYAKVRTPRSERAAAASDEMVGGPLRRTWRFYRGTVSPLRSHVSDALGVTLPFRPYILVTSGVALLLVLLLGLLLPVAIIIRVVLLVT